MFTGNNRVAVYILFGAVLTVCLITLYKVHRFSMEMLKKLDEITRQNHSMSPERETLSPTTMS